MSILMRSLSVVAILIASGVLFLFFSKPELVYSQGAAGVITGYAWGGEDTNSDGIADAGVGWIDLNCLNSSCTIPFGLSVASDGSVSGYAWSEHIGWISANPSELTGCPQSPCTARITNGQLVGWLKALSSETSGSGGWDGFIALGDTDTADGIAYGISLTGGDFSGYAWGSTVVGWLDFSFADTTYLACSATQGYFCSANNTISNHRDAQCVVTQEVCSTLGTGWFCTDTGVCTAPPLPGGALTLSPRIVTSNQTTQITWTVDDTTECQVQGDNGQLLTGGASGSGISESITQATTYTLSCLGGDAVYHEVDEETVSITPGWVER